MTEKPQNVFPQYEMWLVFLEIIYYLVSAERKGRKRLIHSGVTPKVITPEWDQRHFP
jgi:hypothetical protein